MRKIQVTDAKARFSELLTDVERGEAIVVTRRGRAVARIVPEVDGRQNEIDQAIEDIRNLRKLNASATREEILSSIHEGHKY